jgi:hypothetical protein
VVTEQPRCSFKVELVVLPLALSSLHTSLQAHFEAGHLMYCLLCHRQFEQDGVSSTAAHKECSAAGQAGLPKLCAELNETDTEHHPVQVCGNLVQALVWASLIGWIILAEAADLSILGFIFSLMAYVGYTVEYWLAGTRKFFSHIQHEVNAYEYVRHLSVVPPTITFHARCWHYETRTRIVSSTDSQGRHQTRTETYQEMVVTHQRAPAPVLAMRAPLQHCRLTAVMPPLCVEGACQRTSATT